MSQQTEQQLQNGVAGNAQALSDVHNRYSDRLVNSMIAVTRNREEAEDIAAAAFAAAFKNLDAFRGESSLQTWIHAIALNEVRSRRRSPRIELSSIEEADALHIVEPDAKDEAFERRECCPQIWEALHGLPRLYRRTLVDRFVRGNSMKQIAECQRVPLGTALSRLFKAKRLLRAAWEA